MLFQTFLKRYSKKGSVNFHGLPKGSVAWKRLTAPGKPYNARRDKVSGGWYHLSDQRPGHTKVPENAGLLDSLPPSTSRGISQGTHNFPWFPLTRFRGKEPWRSMSGAGRGCSRTAPSACREAGQPLSPTHLFTRPPTNSPPPTLHSAPLPLAAMATTSHQTEPRARPSHRSRSRLTILCPFRPHRSLSFQQVGGRGVPAAEGRNSSFHQGALGVRVRGRPPECLPEKTCPERSRWPACWPLFFF